MPLLDHFHPPLAVERHWEAFHTRWATAIADALNGRLPGSYFAEPQIHAGSRIEVDVASFMESVARHEEAEATNGGGTATLTAPAQVYSPPAPAMSIPAIFPDNIEVRVFSSEAGPSLVAAIELVSPGNKDCEDFRRAFAAICWSYLQQGVGLMIVDIVTSRRASLHNELIELLQAGATSATLEGLYAVAYHPVPARARGPQNMIGPGGAVGQIDIWHAPLAVGQPLPLLPLPLDKGQFIPIDLDSAYTETRQRMRLG